MIAESGLNDPKVMRPREQGGFGHDAAWADDFHHALRALLTGDSDGWYAEFGSVADLAKAFMRPFVHDGQYSQFRHKRFGAPAHDRPPEQFVVFDQDHDQVGNRALGDRLPDDARPLAAFCTLLSPFTPMLFMGEEYGEPAPFQFFSDHIDVRDRRPRRARDAAASSRRSRPFRARRSPTRRTARRSSARSSRASATRGSPASTLRCCAHEPTCHAPRSAPGTTRTHAG